MELTKHLKWNLAGFVDDSEIMEGGGAERQSPSGSRMAWVNGVRVLWKISERLTTRLEDQNSIGQSRCECSQFDKVQIPPGG